MISRRIARAARASDTLPPHVRFFGRGREEPGFAPHRRHVEGTQNLELLGCTANFARVVAVNALKYVVGEATGDTNSCLIDTLRQILKPGGLRDYAGYLARVRRALAAIDFPVAGPFQARDVSHPRGANFREFIEHSHAVVRRLVAHATPGEVESNAEGMTER